MNLKDCHNFSDFRKLAKKKLPSPIFHYIDGAADDATYVYTGFQIPKKSGSVTFTPSFTPGLYSKGDGKDLGHALEFKSEVQLSLDMPKNSQFGFSYNHLSNASLGDKNPGANSYMFNFLKSF